MGAKNAVTPSLRLLAKPVTADTIVGFKKSTAGGALPRTPLGELIALLAGRDGD